MMVVRHGDLALKLLTLDSKSTLLVTGPRRQQEGVRFRDGERDRDDIRLTSVKRGVRAWQRTEARSGF